MIDIKKTVQAIGAVGMLLSGILVARAAYACPACPSGAAQNSSFTHVQFPGSIRDVTNGSEVSANTSTLLGYEHQASVFPNEICQCLDAWALDDNLGTKAYVEASGLGASGVANMAPGATAIWMFSYVCFNSPK